MGNRAWGTALPICHLIGCETCLSLVRCRPLCQGLPLFLCSGKATLNSCPSFWACYDILRAATAEVNNLPWLTKPKKRSSEVRTINLRSII
ncbi:hypothetical protein ILYODFUR_011430 [Ilyodon furcidens]|uniref:Secreted protein n=1 Tax=Ilyodon furcidens TaxID=33524 RepID=A0ABV0SKB9_9TELE